MNHGSGSLRQAKREGYNKKHKAGYTDDSRYDFSISQEANFSLVPDWLVYRFFAPQKPLRVH
jgi:hypothetical protein